MRVITIQADVFTRDVSLQTRNGAGSDDNRGELKFLVELSLPLVTEVGGTKNTDPFRITTVEHFARNQRCFDGFADADVVSN